MCFLYSDKEDLKEEQDLSSNKRSDDVTVKGPKPFDAVSRESGLIQPIFQTTVIAEH